MPLGEGRYEVPSPTLLRAGETLIGLGIPLEKALDVIEDVARQSDSVADAFVKLFVERVWKPFDRSGQPETDWPAVLAALEQLRPLATEVLVAIFQQRMTQATETAFGRELERSTPKKFDEVTCLAANRLPAPGARWHPLALTGLPHGREARRPVQYAACHPSPRSLPPCRR